MGRFSVVRTVNNTGRKALASDAIELTGTMLLLLSRRKPVEIAAVRRRIQFPGDTNR